MDHLVNAMSKYLPVKDVVKIDGQNRFAPVHVAAYFGNLEVILKSKLNFDLLITDNNGKAPLHYAAQQDHLGVVRFLVEQEKCDPSHVDKMKVTPLHLAAGKGHLDIVNYLILEQHCDPLCAAVNDITPLHFAVLHGQLEVVKFYFEHLHCSPDITVFHNITLLQVARDSGHYHMHVVEYLKSIAPDPK